MACERALLRVNDWNTHEVLNIDEIDPDLLHNPPNVTESESTFVGWGSFGVVRYQMYCGIRVAVKELLPHSVAADVHHEARILSLFCHPYLPYLFGMNTSTRPYRLVMQYHGFRDRATSIKLHEALHSPITLRNEQVMLMLCVQLMEAMHYMHSEAKVLHNDLKCNNILICDSITHPPAGSSNDCSVQIVVIDFGKATSVENGKVYHLDEKEQAEYVQKCSHISPELIEGITKQTKMSDMYAAGGVLQSIVGSGILTTDVGKAVDDLATKCHSPNYV